MDAKDESDHGQALVTTEAGWRTEMAKWIRDAHTKKEAKCKDESNNNASSVPATPHI
jgi:hypothetical protein